ncbi:MAG: hypothetical protein ACK4FP_10545 [Azonexus sp.]
MKSNIENKEGQKPSEQPSAAISGHRRKLIRGGVVGAPVLLALKSTPVLACNCKQPSGFSTSGNLSRNGGAACTDPAKGPTYWSANTYDKYISPTKKVKYFRYANVPADTKFKDVFGGVDERTLIVVLREGGFAALVVAAYLDIKAGWFVAGVSLTSIREMWNGTYRPTTGAQPWSKAEGENYLRYVMGLPLR